MLGWNFLFLGKSMVENDNMNEYAKKCVKNLTKRNEIS